MSKQRRPPTREELPAPVAGVAEPSVDAALADRVGNQALQALLGEGPARAPDGRVGGGERPRELAERAALALRVAPREPALTDRLLRVVARSELPAERRAAITDRLRADQAVADGVAEAVRTWLGADAEATRSAWIGAIESAARGEPASEAALAAAVVASLGPTAPEPAVGEGLIRQLALLVHLVWDEEEEEAPAGDYAAEESGF